MKNKLRLRRALKNVLDTKENTVNQIPGLLGTLRNGKKQVKVANRKGFVYVRLHGKLTETVQAYNDQVLQLYDMPVLVKRVQGKGYHYYVTGKDTGRYENWGGNNAQAQYAQHGNQHSFGIGAGGSDVVWVFKRQFMPLMLYPYSGTAVRVAEDWYQWGDTYKHFTGSIVELGSAKPPIIGDSRFVTLYVDGNTNTVKGVTGSVFPSVPFPSDVTPYINVPTPTQGIPLSAVLLTFDTVNIAWNNIYDDIRPLYGVGGGNTAIYVSGTMSNLTSQYIFYLTDNVLHDAPIPTGSIYAPLEMVVLDLEPESHVSVHTYMNTTYQTIPPFTHTFWSFVDVNKSCGYVPAGTWGASLVIKGNRETETDLPWLEFRVDLYKQSSTGAETLISSSNVIREQAGKSRYEFVGTISNAVTLESTSRLLIRIKAQNAFQSEDTRLSHVYLYVNGEANSIIILPISPSHGGGHIIADEGINLTQRGYMNFVGEGVTAYDDGTNTVIRIPGTVAIYNNDVYVGSGTVLDFSEGFEVLVSGSSVFVNVTGTVGIVDWSQVVIVAKSGGDYNTIQGAIDSILDAADDKRYVVFVTPGEYAEQITMKEYVSIVGSDRYSVVLSFTGNDNGNIILADHVLLQNFKIHASLSPSEWGIVGTNKSNVRLLNIEMSLTSAGGVSNGIKLTGDTWHCLFMKDVMINYGGSEGFGVYLSGSAQLADATLEDLFVDSFSATTGGSIFISNLNDIQLRNSYVRTSANGYDVKVDGGGVLTINDSWLEYGNTSLEVGIGTTVYFNGICDSWGGEGDIIGTRFDPDLGRIIIIGDNANIVVNASNGTDANIYLQDEGTTKGKVQYDQSEQEVIVSNENANKDIKASVDGGNLALYNRTSGTVQAALTSLGSLDTRITPSMANPSAGFGRFFAKTDKKPYFINSDGVEWDLSATGSGGGTTTVNFTGTSTYMRAGVPVALDGLTGTCWKIPEGIYATGTVSLFVNGVAQSPGIHFTEQYSESGTFCFTDMPPTGSIFMVIWGAPALNYPTVITKEYFSSYKFTGSLYIPYASGGSITGSALVPFNYKNYDDENCVTIGSEWKFTAPRTGMYHFVFSVGAKKVDELIVHGVINGISVRQFQRGQQAANWGRNAAEWVTRLTSGDTVQLKASLTAASSGSVVTDWTWFDAYYFA